MSELLFTLNVEEEKDNYGRFVIEPLSEGYGHTLGTALRRVLLTSLPGGAITQVKIAGVRHQFSTLPGMKEDIVEFLLNLKEVRLKIDIDRPAKLTLSFKGKGTVKAADIKAESGVKIVNPDLVLANISSPSTKLEVEMQAEKGVGYSPSEERTTGEIGLIPLDAVFSPITRVNYKVEQTRVGRLTNFDRLLMEIWTDSTVKPREALKQAASILVDYFSQVVSPRKPEIKKEVKDGIPQSVAKLSIEELTIPTRIANALLKGGYETVEDLIKAKPEDLSKVRNLGQKSLKIVAAALADRGVKLEIGQ